MYPIFFSEWTEATVHPDCGIQVQKGYYWEPKQHIGQRVCVKMTNSLMTIFALEMAEIAVHAKVGMYKINCGCALPEPIDAVWIV